MAYKFSSDRAKRARKRAASSLYLGGSKNKAVAEDEQMMGGKMLGGARKKVRAQAQKLQGGK
jgi:hypothetical protein